MEERGQRAYACKFPLLIKEDSSFGKQFVTSNLAFDVKIFVFVKITFEFPILEVVAHCALLLFQKLSSMIGLMKNILIVELMKEFQK
nr:PREDICTED: uncharacterized protein LOC107398910 isoform X3 [Tribolium castaneum]|eukprot:XP_015839962.1 PREDICTED: uncharacterized protein LOC107398910 isoform X3 [Tribolium castaneum]